MSDVQIEAQKKRLIQMRRKQNRLTLVNKAADSWLFRMVLIPLSIVKSLVHLAKWLWKVA